MREITEKIYKYEELSEEAKEKALNAHREHFQNDMNENFYDMFKEEIESMGFYDLEPKYSLSFSQGDGCSLIGDIFLDEILGNEDIMKNFTKDEIRRLNHIYSEFDYDITMEQGNLYYHPRTMRASCEVYVNTYTHGRDWELMIDVFDKLQNILEDYFLSLCLNMEEVGYEMLYDEEGLENSLIQCGFEFFEDGSRHY